MVRLSLLFWLSSAINFTAALNDASSAELISYYSAYKSEYAIVPEAQRQIATGCTHRENRSPAGIKFEEDAAAAGVAGICTFDEFVKWILSGRGSWPFTNDMRVLNPEYEAVVDKIYKNIIKPHNDRVKILYWPSRLLPGAGYTGAILDIPLDKVLTALTNALQDSRAHAAGASQAAHDFAEAARADFVRYMRVAKNFRVSDRSVYLRDFVKTVMKNLDGRDVSTYLQTSGRYVLGPDGVTRVDNGKQGKVQTNYLVPAYDETYDEIEHQTGEPLSDDAKEELRVKAAGYGSYVPGPPAPGEGTAQVHQRVLDAQGHSAELMDHPLPSCLAGGHAKRQYRMGRDEI